MRRVDSVTATIAFTVVVAMVLGSSLQRVVATALPDFGFECGAAIRMRGARQSG
jgi:hypothetical protein